MMPGGLTEYIPGFLCRSLSPSWPLKDHKDKSVLTAVLVIDLAC